ncbi:MULTISPECIES: DUF2797 domain-containing protein [Micromonospora]|uniref:DUF2797 domain-containing protein n=1 Tax=Micromonospora antibiotica TaxID=2807623 RepID=A0ABS3V7X8_9ACTN|nr:DUF2797 domain-containing protein [Micromonospora antibiotica]MBO4161723.1 DUF2797 domain-containing protein [Micromonospora antibiotica]
MSQPSTGLLATGTVWTSGSATLALAASDGTIRQQPLSLGQLVGWNLHGPRRCIGTWNGETRRQQLCPHRHPIEVDASASQCPPCQAADPGRRFARGDDLTDPRTFGLYLAWFAPGLIKVGLTAVDRGNDRLTEQAAVAFTWLAEGPLPAVRRAERLISGLGEFGESVRRDRKVSAWWHLGEPQQRIAQLRDAWHRTVPQIAGDARLTVARPRMCDLADTYGLNTRPSSPAREIGPLRVDVTLVGRISAVAGSDLILDTIAGPGLLNTRTLAGWTLTSADVRGAAAPPMRALNLVGTHEQNVPETLF